MEKNKKKFFSLTPEVLEDNEKKQIYIDALDYAFANSNIKNIAITGIYGAGKSSVWKTYLEDRQLCDIITVSLGKYEDNIENLNNSDDIYQNDTVDKVNIKMSNNSSIDTDNRIERQLINQILSQIKQNKIPLSKYRYKSNKSNTYIILQTFLIILIILSVLLWFSRESIIKYIKEFNNEFDPIYFIIFCILLFLPAVVYFSFIFLRDNRFIVSKINIKGTEANLKDNDNNDESILDRDIKEIVYLLISSETKVVVIEDLDRYDNIGIFTKLRELNFLVNKYLETNDEYKNDSKIIRFVYMVKDGLFVSKNRTKFFDFIIPIVPVINSKNSESKFKNAIKNANNKPDNNIITKISMYIDDMRLLNNIANEFIIYENIIAIRDLGLDVNKLLALIVLKNIFPLEFDLLQEDKGYIYRILTDIDNYKNIVNEKLVEKLNKINDELSFLQEHHENGRFEVMATMISPNVQLVNIQDVSTWAQFLKNQSLKPDEPFRIAYARSSNNNTYNSFNYETFIDKFILTTQERKDLVEKFPIDKNARIQELLNEKVLIEKQIKEMSLKPIKEQLKIMPADKLETIFTGSKEKITQSHYFSLIRFLILEGLLDETYWHYKGCFYKGSLEKNDTIFIKNLLEAKKQDIFLNIENPHEVKVRLDISDFERFNILNKKLLEICIESNSKNQLYSIINSVQTYNNYEQLIKIIDTYNYELTKRFVDIIIEYKAKELVKILDRCVAVESNTFKNILLSVCVNKNIEINTLKLFSEFIEQYENIISLVLDKEFEIFIKNMSDAEIKFMNISKSNADVTRVKELAEIKAYVLNVSNVKFITGMILGESVDRGKLISIIYNSNMLISTKEYIEENFVKFVTTYVDENALNESFSNEEDIVIKIINSSLPVDYKKKYIELNKTMVSDISKINDLETNVFLVEELFASNNIIFNVDNITTYWNSIHEYSDKFVTYIDMNINDNNYEEILLNNIEICNVFINDADVTDKLFNYTIIFANEKIEKLDADITKDRLQILIDKNLILTTDENFKILLKKSYFKEITSLISSQENNLEDDAIGVLLRNELDAELIYELINSNISYANSIKLLNKITNVVLIEKIDFEKIDIIGYLIEVGLSDININYICKHFDKFFLKEEFVYYLDINNKFDKIKNENISQSFIEFVLSSNDISYDSKTDLVVIKIKSKSKAEEIKEIISNIKIISKLAEVWDNKRPALDNSYKNKVGNALLDEGYVYKRNDKDWIRIVEKKQ
ncbi:hypothetical protein B5E91_12655 [Thomasclavelia spiroformis]|uniref:YobI-like P-loop NTPase domain-containing protein n=3 Tax=Thomasclavelia spiroformis TaxID=29348 RepID=A0A1Y4QGS6_9FIRM|nr:hypothetical protein [Thomasclavelia spiroformis]OUP99172.1 hypothetical protein B5E98_11170 [Thomasclavelia spiroformis]OUQ03493.1 hypothetical protein B5E91_12655 [Thomasclavelia spiroformis]